MAAHQAPPSLGFSRQEQWSELPFPSPMHESESEVTQSCLTLSDPLDCSPPGSFVHGTFQARVLEWDAIAFSEYYSLIKDFSSLVQFSSVSQLCQTLCDPMDCSTPGLPVHHQLLELAQTQVHGVGDAIQPSHPLSSPSPPTFNLSQRQGLFQGVSSSHQVAKVLELQLQHQSLQ